MDQACLQIFPNQRDNERFDHIQLSQTQHHSHYISQQTIEAKTHCSQRGLINETRQPPESSTDQTVQVTNSPLSQSSSQVSHWPTKIQGNLNYQIACEQMNYLNSTDVPPSWNSAQSGPNSYYNENQTRYLYTSDHANYNYSQHYHNQSHTFNPSENSCQYHYSCYLESPHIYPIHPPPAPPAAAPQPAPTNPQPSQVHSHLDALHQNRLDEFRDRTLYYQPTGSQVEHYESNEYPHSTTSATTACNSQFINNFDQDHNRSVRNYLEPEAGHLKPTYWLNSNSSLNISTNNEMSVTQSSLHYQEQALWTDSTVFPMQTESTSHSSQQNQRQSQPAQPQQLQHPQQQHQQNQQQAQQFKSRVSQGHQKSSSRSASSVGSVQRSNQCEVCGRNYARPSTLKTHLRTHTNERPFKCNVCFKTFSQAANLTAHQRVHTGERPFSCPICGRQFSQSSSVITHLRTHSGERPYRCSMCSSTFSDSSTLTKHCRIHSGEKPYQCDYCPLNFSQSGNLSRHLKLHLIGTSVSVPPVSKFSIKQTDSNNCSTRPTSTTTTTSTVTKKELVK